MRVLVGCEFSGTVRDAFARRGHDAWSCDLLPSETPGNHIHGDVLDILDDGWDLGIFHDPCTYQCNSGVQWLHTEEGRWEELKKSCEFTKKLFNAPIDKICRENPIPHKYAVELIGKKYNQIIQPWMFGHDASKATCLWLENLLPLESTNEIEPALYGCRCGYKFSVSLGLGKYGCPNCCGEYGAARLIWGNQTPSGQNNIPPGINQAKERSRTFPGIAEAMASQWGSQ